MVIHFKNRPKPHEPCRRRRTTATPQKTMLLLMNPQKNAQGLCHRYHLFFPSRRQGLPRHAEMRCGMFPNVGLATTVETVKSLFSSLIVGTGGTVTCCSLGHRMYRSAKGCLSVNFPLLQTACEIDQVGGGVGFVHDLLVGFRFPSLAQFGERAWWILLQPSYRRLGRLDARRE